MTAIQFVDESPSALNGTQGPFVVESSIKRSGTEAGLDSDSDSDTEEVHVQQHSISGPRPGKKTKGRVKIKMEFIENKLRRYTTFSKRKTGIMKKAYELSTLTGTQVMLLVASETGHVYTFATRKLQPMITSESGKALIQTCLNSPDAPTNNPASTIDSQRMNPTGFEEPELSYGISEDEQPKASDSPSMARLYSNTIESSPSPNHLVSGHVSSSNQDLVRQGRSPTPNPPPAHNNSSALNSYISASNASSSPNNNKSGVMTCGAQNPSVNAAPLILSTASYASGTSVNTAQNQQTLYRIPAPIPGQVVNLPVPTHMQSVNKSGNNESPSSTVNSSKTGNGTNNATATGTIMYQTPQGVVYATAPSTTVPGLPEGYILNLPQTPSIQAMQDQQSTGAQQYITIPVPVSLAAADGAQMLQPMIAQAQAAASSNPSLIQQLSKSK